MNESHGEAASSGAGATLPDALRSDSDRANLQLLSAGCVWIRHELNRLIAHQRAEQRRLMDQAGIVSPTDHVLQTPLNDSGRADDSLDSLEHLEQELLHALKSAGQAREAWEDSCQRWPHASLLEVASRFHLCTFELHTLLLAVACHFDTGLSVLCGMAQGSEQREYPTFGLAASLFEGATWQAMSAAGTLRRTKLVEVVSAGNEDSVALWRLQVDERVISQTKGLVHLDSRLMSHVRELRDRSWLLGHLFPRVYQQATETVVRSFPPPAPAWAEPPANPAPDRTGTRRELQSAGSLARVLKLDGGDAWTRGQIALGLGQELRARTYQVLGELLPQDPLELAFLADLWIREHHLSPVVLFLDAATERCHMLLDCMLPDFTGVIVLHGGDAGELENCGAVVRTVAVPHPSAAEQAAAWVAGDPRLGAMAEMLAEQYDLRPGQIVRLLEQFRDESFDDQPRDRLRKACQEITRAKLEPLAPRLAPKASWPDLVLPSTELRLLRQLAAQFRLRHRVYEEWGLAEQSDRGLGITALFSGESGTGKTMAAEVVANELELDLFRVDLASVVSKFIGETEKNLQRLFDAAEHGGAVLLFDEADALFGRRSEVKDAHDRYANIEINYLLQRMESYRGLAILATNREQALDEAFLRRIRHVVRFPFPDRGMREAIWRGCLPPRLVCEPLDFGRLAELNLAGGNIRSVVTNAAFLAAGEGDMLRMRHLAIAVEDEFLKLKRTFDRRKFALDEPAG